MLVQFDLLAQAKRSCSCVLPNLSSQQLCVSSASQCVARQPWKQSSYSHFPSLCSEQESPFSDQLIAALLKLFLETPFLFCGCRSNQFAAQMAKVLSLHPLWVSTQPVILSTGWTLPLTSQLWALKGFLVLCHGLIDQPKLVNDCMDESWLGNQKEGSDLEVVLSAEMRWVVGLSYLEPLHPARDQCKKKLLQKKRELVFHQLFLPCMFLSCFMYLKKKKKGTPFSLA